MADLQRELSLAAAETLDREHQLQHTEAELQALQGQLHYTAGRQRQLEQQLQQAQGQGREEFERLLAQVQGKAAENAAMKEGIGLLMDLLQEQGPLPRPRATSPTHRASGAAASAHWRPGGAPPSPRPLELARSRSGSVRCAAVLEGCVHRGRACIPATCKRRLSQSMQLVRA